jgi:hypothetical protein
VSSAKTQPKWRTGVLWGILAVFLIIGTTGAATVVYGAMSLATGDVFGLIPLVIGAVVAVLGFLFIAGILYRVDRYRGTNQRRVELFE